MRAHWVAVAFIVGFVGAFVHLQALGGRPTSPGQALILLACCGSVAFLIAAVVDFLHEFLTSKR